MRRRGCSSERRRLTIRAHPHTRCGPGGQGPGTTPRCRQIPGAARAGGREGETGQETPSTALTPLGLRLHPGLSKGLSLSGGLSPQQCQVPFPCLPFCVQAPDTGSVCITLLTCTIHLRTQLSDGLLESCMLWHTPRGQGHGCIGNHAFEGTRNCRGVHSHAIHVLEPMHACARATARNCGALQHVDKKAARAHRHRRAALCLRHPGLQLPLGILCNRHPCPKL